MHYDLEEELLRAACESCESRGQRDRDGDVFTLDMLRETIANAPARYPRLGHPLLAHLVDSLVGRLVVDGMLAHVATGYAVTDRGRSLSTRVPRFL